MQELRRREHDIQRAVAQRGERVIAFARARLPRDGAYHKPHIAEHLIEVERLVCDQSTQRVDEDARSTLAQSRASGVNVEDQ